MKGAELAQLQKKRLSWAALTLVFTGVGALFGLALALYCFGSLGSALAYLEGDRLIADSFSRSFGEVQPGERPTLTFELTNTSDRKITILGAKTLCTCVFAENLPLSVPARSRRSINVAVKTDSRKGPIRESVYLFTDSPKQPQVELHVLGRVAASGGEPAKTQSK
jgi:hypothetical protein